jgi:endonuclease/exonuclease/phosphatase family metal-dependent hydrolase
MTEKATVSEQLNLKLVSLNLWNGGMLFPRIVSFLNAESPDVLLLQEVQQTTNLAVEKRFRSCEELKQTLGFEYSFFSPAFAVAHQNTIVECGNAILSHFPIHATRTVFFDRPYAERLTSIFDPSEAPRNLQSAVIDIGTRELNVCNVHGIWGSDGEDNPRRLEMCKTIVDIVKAKESLILSGDFNVRENTESIRSIERLLNNVFKGRIKTSFNLKHKDPTVFGESVVDMMFVSKEIEVVHSYCPKADISDHLPQIIVFKIAPRLDVP